jgi:hypothetical protein
MKPISLLRGGKLAIKHLNSGVHFIGVATFSVYVLKYLRLYFTELDISLELLNVRKLVNLNLITFLISL